MNTPSLTHAWDVLLLFLIPIGGGIPAGVLLAKAHGLAWPLSMLLYFISDVILACVFDPLMHLMIAFGRYWPKFGKAGNALKTSILKSASSYGPGLGPFSLIMVAFGVDPMTGAATAIAGHGFITGWALSIAGDMLYFTLLMVSTLWLNQIIGDADRTIAIILVAMIFGPITIRKIRERRKAAT